MAIDSINATLKDTPEVLDVLGMYSTNDILLLAVIDGLMLITFTLQQTVGAVFVRIYGCRLVDAPLDFRN